MYLFSIGERGKHAALDITVTSPLIPSILTAASLSEEAAAEEAEVRKHRANDPKCSELGWVCIPLAVETYGNKPMYFGLNFLMKLSVT